MTGEEGSRSWGGAEGPSLDGLWVEAGNLVVAVGLSTWHFVSPRTFSIETLTQASNSWRKERTGGP